MVGEDATAWTMGEPLPSSREGTKGVSLGNRFMLIGMKKMKSSTIVLTANTDDFHCTITYTTISIQKVERCFIIKLLEQTSLDYNYVNPTPVGLLSYQLL